MLVKKLEGLPRIKIECPTCCHLFKATIFSRAFSSGEELICSSCGVQACLSLSSNVGKYFESSGSTAEYIENYFRNCECGGHFVFAGRRYDMYRCPNCNQLLGENFLVAKLGIDVKAWKSGTPFSAHVEIDNKEIDYTNPGFETIGHIDEELWNHDTDDKKFHEALIADREFRIKCAQEEETFNKLVHDIQRKITDGVLPYKIYLMAGLNDFLFIKVGDRYCNINPTELCLPMDLIDKCRGWARLGSYVEDGVWGEGDLPEAFTKTSWDDYLQAGSKIQKKLQAALANRTIVEVLVESDGEPFFEVKAER